MCVETARYKGSALKSNDKLQDLRLLFDGLLQSIDTILLVLHADYRIREWNQLADRFLGFAGRDMHGVPLNSIGGPDYLPRLLEAIERSLKEKKTFATNDLRWKDEEDSVRYFSFRVVPMFGSGGAHLGFAIFGIDVTHEREVLRQHEEGRKFQAIGELTGGIAHEINTPIQFIQNNLLYLRDSLDKVTKVLEKCGREGERSGGSTARPHLAEIRALFSEFPDAISQSLDGIDRIAAIIRSLRNYSHPGTGEPELFDLVKAVQDAITISVNEWKNTATLNFESPDDAVSISGFSSQITQAMVNLIVNACYTLEERYGEEAITRGRIDIRVEKQDDLLSLTVQDNGMGMSEEVSDRIFEPFFTTKPIGKGTGQGLAQVYSSIVGIHDGTLQVESALGEGTLFSITLPEAQ